MWNERPHTSATRIGRLRQEARLTWREDASAATIRHVDKAIVPHQNVRAMPCGHGEHGVMPRHWQVLYHR
jgi:hypothetical protein